MSIESIKSINPYKDFSKKSTAQKVGIVAGTVVGAAAIASVPLAFVQGKKVISADGFQPSEKLAEKMAKKDGKAGIFATMGEGYKKIGSVIKENFEKIFKKKKAEEAAEGATAKAENAAEGATAKAEEAAEGAVAKAEEAAEGAADKAGEAANKAEGADK